MPHRLRKTRWYRGSRTCGWGRVGQHRKSGARGGFGNAGLRKHKRFYMMKYEPDHFGYRGFKSIYPEKKVINLSDLNKFIEEGMDVINLDEMGFDKLLGKGELIKPVKIIVKEASKKAIEKVKKINGKIILLKEASE